MRQTVLLVEDNPITRQSVKVALERDGYRVLEAGDGRTAVRLMDEHAPEVVLQDVLLPDLDGFDLAHRLRRGHPGSTPRILAMTGLLSPRDEARVSAAGFDDWIAKPIDSATLLRTVRQHTRPSASSREPFGMGRRVLLADDDPLQLKLVRFHLQRAGFEVSTATDGQEALEMAEASLPDIIVSDVMMPRLDGYGLCLAVRSNRKLAGIPLVLVTSTYIEDADRDLAGRAGADEFAVRTPDLREALEAVRRCVERTPGRKKRRHPEPGSPTLEKERQSRVIRQLEHQVALNSGIAQRCSLQAAELSVLSGISDALARQQELKTALDDAVAACLDAGGIERGVLYLEDAEGELQVSRYGDYRDFDDAAARSFFGQQQLLERIISEGQPRAIPSDIVPEEEAQAFLLSARATSALLVPILFGDERLGALLFTSDTKDCRQFDLPAFASAVAGQIGHAVALARAFRRATGAERRYRTLMERANDAICTLTSDGVAREVNHRWEEILGVSRDRIVGRRLEEFVVECDREGFSRHLETVAKDGAKTAPLGLQRADGSIALMELSSTTLEVESDRLVFTIGRDVTEQVRTQEQLMFSDRMASVGTLAAGVAHEINNPLLAVTANLGMAVDDVVRMAVKLGPRDFSTLHESLRDARDAAERVRQIVLDLRIFSRSDGDQRGPVDVNRVLESSLRMAWNEIRHRAHLVKEYGEVPLVDANDSRLGQVFLNLIVNAVQAIPEGRMATNEIRAVTWLDPHKRVVIEIRDTGAGIPPEVRQRLFTPFFTTKPPGVGTGLGLSICRRIVTSLGGDIEMESEVGKGSLFRVRLPASTQEPQGRRRPPTALALGRRGNILVVDDETVIGSVIRRGLASQHDVATETDARDALARLRRGEAFDLILCDLMMPTMTGMEFFAQIAVVAPGLERRIIFMTGGAFTAEARAFMDVVPNAWIEKPFDIQALKALMARQLTDAMDGAAGE